MKIRNCYLIWFNFSPRYNCYRQNHYVPKWFSRWGFQFLYELLWITSIINPYIEMTSPSIYTYVYCSFPSQSFIVWWLSINLSLQKVTICSTVCVLVKICFSPFWPFLSRKKKFFFPFEEQSIKDFLQNVSKDKKTFAFYL